MRIDDSEGPAGARREHRLAGAPAVLIAGLPGAGKSTLIAGLAGEGHRLLDTDPVAPFGRAGWARCPSRAGGR